MISSKASVRSTNPWWTQYICGLLVWSCLALVCFPEHLRAQFSLKSSEASGQTAGDQEAKTAPELTDPALAPWLRYPIAPLPSAAPGFGPGASGMTGTAGITPGVSAMPAAGYGMGAYASPYMPPGYAAPGYPGAGYPATAYPGSVYGQMPASPAALGNALPNSSVVTSAPGVPNTFLPAQPFVNGNATSGGGPQMMGSNIIVPVQPQRPNGPLQIQAHNQLVTIYAQDVDLRQVLNNLSVESRVNIVVAENVTGRVTTALRDVPLWHALDAILKVNGLVWSQQGDIVFVNRPNAVAVPISTSMPGQMLQIYELNYVSGVEVVEIVKGLLSPGGRAFTHTANINSSRQTRERLIVEDYPDRLQKIAHYLQTVDTPPRQVLIEASVLQVTLTNEDRHGVNLDGLARVSGARVRMWSQGFADDTVNPGFLIGLDGTDLNGLLDCLKSNSRVRTLASPKVLVVNGQEARIQIGSKFGYFVTTTTQTATLQNVNFLDIGVVLQVKPIISQDEQVLLTVQPKVSGGRINPSSKLPEEETTEATTTVLLPNGRGMVIGGLIKDADTKSESMIPWLGERPFIGRLFRKWSFKKERVEVIIALTPHIVPYGDTILAREAIQYTETTGMPAQWDPTCLTPGGELEAPQRGELGKPITLDSYPGVAEPVVPKAVETEAVPKDSPIISAPPLSAPLPGLIQ